ncbi:MAG: hypothetical protein AAF216_04235 [Pseudomonadota bacterium]
MTTKPPPDDADPIEAVLEDPIDAEFREAEPEKARARSGPGWFSSLILALFAALSGGALGYGATQYLSPTASTPAAEPDTRLETLTSQIDATITALEDDLGDLETRLEVMSEADTSADLNDLAERIVALENRPTKSESTSDGDITPALAAIDTLSQRLDAMEGENTTDSVGQDAVDALSAEILFIKNGLSDLESRIENLSRNMTRQAETAGAEADARADAAIALASIDAAARRGDGFAPALAALNRSRPDDRRLEQLEPFALDGAPTRAELSTTFPDVVEATRAALVPDAASSGVLGAAGRIFGDALQVRDPAAESAYAALETAEAAMARRDLDAALSALRTLDNTSKPAKAALADWISAAEARQTLESVLDSLRLDLMAEDR